MRDGLRINADMMVAQARQLASLRVPARIGQREAVVNEVALAMSLDRLIDAAMHDAAQPPRMLHAIATLVVNRGRQNGLTFVEIADAMHGAIAETAIAKAEQEAQEQEAKEARKTQAAGVELQVGQAVKLPRA